MAYLAPNTMTNQFTEEPGTPEWWLKLLCRILLDRQVDFRIRKNYAEGYHPVPNGDPRYRKVLKDFQYKARTNYCGLVNTAPTERMHVRGFLFGDGGEVDPDATAIWQYNNMDLQAMRIHNRAAKFGLAYALVEEPDEGEKWPIITAEDPRQCIVFHDPRRPTKALAGLKMWVDAVDDTVRAVLYLPDATYAFQGPAQSRIDVCRDTTDIMQVLFGSVNRFQPAGARPNPLGEVQLVEYVWRPDSADLPEAEADESVRDIQDRINHTVLDRLVISRNQAYRQRFVSGMAVARNKKGKKGDPPFDPGADTLWVAPNPDAKFGEFSTADIRQILEATRDDIINLAAITKTPPHYLMGTISNVSGDTLTQALDGLIEKTKERMQSIGWSHEALMKLCFKYINQADKAKDATATVRWADPATYTVAELADAGVKWQTAGIPLELIMRKQNIWTEDEIKFAAEKQAEQQALDQQQAQQQMDHQMAMAATTAAMKPAAAKPAVKKTAPKT